MRRFSFLALLALFGCGVASISPIVTDADLVDEPRLAGTWVDPEEGKETAVITTTGRGTFDVVYTEKNGQVGRFHGRLGRLGPYRVLDVQPQEEVPAPSDVYRSLVLRAHGILVIDSIGRTIQFRMVGSDSLKAYLRLHPTEASHALTGNSVLLTASTPEVRRFLQNFLARPGMLGEPTVFRRRAP